MRDGEAAKRGGTRLFAFEYAFFEIRRDDFLFVESGAHLMKQRLFARFADDGKERFLEIFEKWFRIISPFFRSLIFKIFLLSACWVYGVQIGESDMTFWLETVESGIVETTRS